MKKLALIFIVCCVAVVSSALYVSANMDYPQLRDGDLIFQTSTSSQSGAIFAATGSTLTHMGIIKNDATGIVVIDAGAKVAETPLDTWVKRGLARRVVIYRNPNLTSKQAGQVLAFARTLYGRPYDLFFSFKNRAIYCSELPYLAYGSAGISIGNVQKLSDLRFDNVLVRKLIETRWQRHSECTERKYDFEQCYRHLLDQELITPVSIADDPVFVKIYSNYPY